MKSRFDIGFNGGVEASESIVTEGVGVAVLVDVVLVVSFANLVDSEENVDHVAAHLLFFLFFFFSLLFGWNCAGREIEGKYFVEEMEN